MADIKKMYEFKMDVERTEGEGDKKVTIKESTKCAIRKPTRNLLDEGDLFYSVKISEGIQKGLITRALMAKRLVNDGGILSEPEKETYVKLYTDLFEKQQELQSMSLKSESERSQEEKDKLNKLMEEMANVRKDLHNFEASQAALFEHTAEARARNKTIIWWVLFLSYIQGEKDKELKPLFGNGSYEERLAAFEKLEEDGNSADRAIAERMVMYVTFWYSGGATEAKDFENFEKEFGVVTS